MGRTLTHNKLDKKIDEVITILEGMNLRMYAGTLMSKWKFKFIIPQKDFLKMIGKKK